MPARRELPADRAAVVYILPDEVLAKLEGYCAASGERLLDVVIDAVDLHLDELEGADLECEHVVDAVLPEPEPAEQVLS